MMDATISSNARMMISLDLGNGGKKEIVIDWVQLIGQDQEKQEVKDWCREIFNLAGRTRIDCQAAPICKDLAESFKKLGHKLCLDCDFFKTGIDERGQKSLNEILMENGGRERAADKSSQVIFRDLTKNPIILLKYGDQLGIRVRQAKVSEVKFWEKTQTSSGSTTKLGLKPLRKKMVVEREEKSKPIEDNRKIRNGRSETRKSWSRLSRLKLRFKSRDSEDLGKMAKSKAAKIALKWANELDETVEVWKRGKGGKEDIKVVAIKPGQKIPLKKQPKQTRDYRGEPRKPVQTVKERNLPLPKLVYGQLGEKARKIFENLPISIDGEGDGDWVVINVAPTSNQGKIFLCLERVGPLVLFRGAVTAEELNKLILDASSKPIPGEIIIRSLTPAKLCKIFNKLCSNTFKAREPILEGG